MIGKGGCTCSQLQKGCSTAFSLEQAFLRQQSKASKGQALTPPATAQAGSLHTPVRLIFEFCYLPMQQKILLRSLTFYSLIFPAILTQKSSAVSFFLGTNIIYACSSPVQVNMLCDMIFLMFNLCSSNRK